MKKTFKIFCSLLLTLLITFGGIKYIDAATASMKVSSSSSKVVVGKSFTVTVKVSSGVPLGSYEYTLSYDSSKVKLTSGSTYNIWYAPNGSTKSNSKSFTFKAVGSGTSNISVKSAGGYAYDESAFSISTTSTSVKTLTQAELQASYSKNNNLSSLTIDGQELKPGFNKDTTSYTVSLGANVTTININAKTEDSTASVSGAGNIAVVEGDNKIEIVVTAQNGSTKKYTIVATVVDPNPINVKIGDKTLTVVKRESILTPPQNYELKKITMSEQEIPVFYNDTTKYTLIGLKDSDGNIGFYVYDEKNNTFNEYSEIIFSGLTIYPMEAPKDTIGNYTKTNITIGEGKYPGFKINSNKEYSIIYGMDIHAGTTNYYLYDEVTNTLVRYNSDEIDSLTKELKQYKFIIYILIGESAFLFIILIGMLIKKSIKNNKKRKFIKEKQHEKFDKEETKEPVKEEIIEETIVEEKVENPIEEKIVVEENTEESIEEIKQIKNKKPKKKKKEKHKKKNESKMLDEL